MQINVMSVRGIVADPGDREVRKSHAPSRLPMGWIEGGHGCRPTTLRKALLWSVCSLGVLCGWTGEVFGSNPRSVPIGGRTATMGGAATAAGKDSAMPYINPAGMAGLPSDIFAVSATVHRYESATYGTLFYPRGFPDLAGPWTKEESSSSQSTLQMPSSVMYFSHLPAPGPFSHVLGIAMVAPSADQRELVASARADLPSSATRAVDTISTSESRTDFYIGPSYGLQLGRDLRLGASLFALYSRAVKVRTASSRFDLSKGAYPYASEAESSTESSSIGAVAVAGLQWNPLSQLWLGAAVASPSQFLTGSAATTARRSGSWAGVFGAPGSESKLQTFEGRVQANRPWRVNVGAAWESPSSVSVAADLWYHAGRTDARVVEGVNRVNEFLHGDVAREYESNVESSEASFPVFDVSLGVEVPLLDWMRVRGGVFTDRSTAHDVDALQDSVAREKVDFLGGTLGAGFLTGSFESTVGVSYAYGQGKYGASDTTSQEALESQSFRVVPTDLTVHRVMLVLSGAVSTEEAKRTIEEQLPPGLPSTEPTSEGRGRRRP